MTKPLSITCVALLSVFTSAAQAQLLFDGSSYSQNFNSLPTGDSSGSNDNFAWNNDISDGSNNTISDWYFSTSNKNFDDSDDGRALAPTGDTSRAGTDRILSFGATGTTTDRSMGLRAQGFNTAPDGAAFGLRLRNNSGGTLTSLEISFTAQQWFQESSAGSLDFYYYDVNGVDSSFTGLRNEGADPMEITTNGTLVSQLSYTAPQTGSDSIIDGTLGANSSALSHTITGLSWENGDDFWVVWNKDTNTSALAIDNLSIVPEPSTAAFLLFAGLAGALARRRRAS